jgi:alkylated DNA repair protein (DNA oxidative demethylase)
MYIENIYDGITVLRNYFDRSNQLIILSKTRSILAHSPFFTPKMSSGTQFNSKLSNIGSFGWVAGEGIKGEGYIPQSDNKNYRYQKVHPVTGKKWLPIPHTWQEHNKNILDKLFLPYFEPQSALINWYPEVGGKLGMHQDKTEKDLVSPIITWSLGNSCTFKVSKNKSGESKRLELDSGDVLVMHGTGRMYWHGVMKIHDNVGFTKNSGRLSITFRKIV